MSDHLEPAVKCERCEGEDDIGLAVYDRKRMEWLCGECSAEERSYGEAFQRRLSENQVAAIAAAMFALRVTRELIPGMPASISTAHQDLEALIRTVRGRS